MRESYPVTHAIDSTGVASAHPQKKHQSLSPPLEDPRVHQFYDALAHAMRAKMARTGASYRDVALAAGLTTKNAAFRAATEEDRYWGLSIANLARLIAWLDLEPRDFTQQQTARPQDLELAVFACHDMTLRDRCVLVDLIRTFINATRGSSNAAPRPRD